MMEQTFSFGYWVRRRRLALDLTQSALALDVGCATVTIRKIERDERRPSRTMAVRLADSLDISEEDRETFIRSGLGEVPANEMPLSSKPLSKRQDQVEPSTAIIDELPVRSEGVTPIWEVTSLPAHNLPSQPTPFVGRERELVELDALIADPDIRLISIVGPGGIGKTRFALEAAGRELHPGSRFTDGIFFVSLAPVESLDEIIPTLATALDFHFQDSGDEKKQLLNYLQHRKMLLIMDNFEQILDGQAFLAELNSQAARIKLVVTSRDWLQLRGEQIFPLQGLKIPGIKDDGEEIVVEFAAAQLFMNISRRTVADFQLLEGDEEQLARICQLVEGMPLGLELAASWVGMLPLSDIAAEIEQGLDLLTSEKRDMPPRHRSMQAALDISWRRLSSEQQDAFQQLSVFRGGFTRTAALEVAGAALPLLVTLVNKSWLSYDLQKDRYYVHELLRQYGTDKLGVDTKIEYAVRERHSTYYNTIVEQWGHDLKSKRQEIALKEMDLEFENARMAWKWAVKDSRVDLVSRSIEGFRHYFAIRIRWQEAERTFRQAAERFKSATSGNELLVYARLLSLRGHFTHGDERQWELYHQSQAVINQLDSLGQDIQHEKATILNFMGELASKSDFEESLGFYRQSLGLFEESGDRYWVSDTLYGLGVTYYLWGKLDDAHKFQGQSLTNFRELGDPRKIAHILGQLDYIYRRQGQFEKAERANRERLEIYESIGDPAMIAFGRGELGSSFRYLGEYEAAETLLATAMEVHQELEHISGYFVNAIDLCFVKLDLGRYIQAFDLAQSAMDWSGGRILPLPGWPVGRDSEKRRMGITLTVQGMASLAQGNVAEAELLLQRSSDVLQEIQPITLTAYHHPALGIASLNSNKPDQAKGYILDGLKVGNEISSAMVHLFTLGAAALYLADQGNLERGIEIYTLARRYPWIAKSQLFQDVIEIPLSTLTASLPPEIIAEAQERGQERNLEETVQELLAELS